jgi:hypothetical protein
LTPLQLLQRPAIEFYSWVMVNDEQPTVPTARSERDAVTVVAVKDKLFPSPTLPENTAADFASQLPDTKAAHTHSLN